MDDVINDGEGEPEENTETPEDIDTDWALMMQSMGMM